MVGGVGAPGVSVLADPIGSIAAEGAGLSRISPDSLCELPARPGWHPARVCPGHCERARVRSRGAAAGMCVRADEVVEGGADRRRVLGVD